jgi:hypothetical protein
MDLPLNLFYRLCGANNIFAGFEAIIEIHLYETMNLENLIKELTLEEKAALLSGVTNWQTTPIDRLAIPSVFMADGPTGLRKEMPGGQFLAPSYPATCFPLPVTVASSWNPSLLEKVARRLAREAIDQKVDTVWDRAVNIQNEALWVVATSNIIPKILIWQAYSARPSSKGSRAKASVLR